MLKLLLEISEHNYSWCLCLGTCIHTVISFILLCFFHHYRNGWPQSTSYGQEVGVSTRCTVTEMWWQHDTANQTNPDWVTENNCSHVCGLMTAFYVDNIELRMCIVFNLFKFMKDFSWNVRHYYKLSMQLCVGIYTYIYSSGLNDHNYTTYVSHTINCIVMKLLHNYM